MLGGSGVHPRAGSITASCAETHRPHGSLPIAALAFDFTALIDGVSRTHAVRVVTLEGAPWFAGSDVREVLDITQAGSNYRTLHADELRTVNRRGQTSLVGFDWGKANRVTLVSESGLYKLIMRSDKPQARPFQDWVTREVLPSIRKHGAYARPKGEAVPLPVAYPQVQHVGMPRGGPPTDFAVDAPHRNCTFLPGLPHSRALA